MYNNKRQFGGKLPVKTLAQDYHDELMRDQTAYALFCADLINCQKLNVDVDDVNGDTGHYWILLLRSCPLLIYRIEAGAAGGGDSSTIAQGMSDRFGGDFAEATYHHLVNKKSATVTSDYFLSMWLAQTYGRLDEYRLRNSLGIMLDITNTTLSQREIWDRNKHIMFQSYAENDLPVFQPPITGMDDPIYVGPQDVSQVNLPPEYGDEEEEEEPEVGSPSYSETMWSQLTGYYTAYFDNLGVFMIHGLQLDYAWYLAELQNNAWQDMRRFVTATRILNAGEQENVDVWNAWFGTIPVIGGLDDAYTFAATKRHRYYCPRVAAFDRQRDKLDEYPQYVQRARRCGARLPGEYQWFERLSMRFKMILTEDQWHDFLFPLFATGSVLMKYAPDSIIREIEDMNDERRYQKTFKAPRRSYRRY